MLQYLQTAKVFPAKISILQSEKVFFCKKEKIAV